MVSWHVMGWGALLVTCSLAGCAFSLRPTELEADAAADAVGSMQNGSGAAESQFNGSLDDFRIYTRALTNIELCTLANRAATCLP